MDKQPLENPNPIDGQSVKKVQAILGRWLALSKVTFSSLQSPQFSLYYTAYIFQTTSMNMQVVARSLLIYRIADSAVTLGLMSLAFALPMLMLAYYGGYLADRYPKRTLMLYGYFVSTMLAFLVGFAIRTGYLGTSQGDSWWLLMVTAIIQGVTLALTTPSRQAIVAELLPPKHIQNAVALTSLGMNAMRMLGPAIAGFVIEFAGFDIAFLVTGGLSLLGWLLLWFLPSTTRPAGERESMLRSLKEGLSYIWQDRTIMLVLGFSVLVFAFGLPFFTMMPVFADDILQVGASGMGLLLTTNGVGSVVGSLLLASRPPRKRGKILLWSILFLGLGVIVFSFSTNWYLSLVVMVITGLAIAFIGAITPSLLLNYAAKEYHGRIMSVFMMQEGLASLGAMLAGAIADSLKSIQWAVGGLAIVLPVAALIGLVRVKRVVRLE